jgi:hypothetical protein
MPLADFFSILLELVSVCRSRDLKDRSDAAMYHKHLAGEPMKQLVGMTKGRRVFVMQCGFHAYMESWGLAMENPYYALTD